MNYKSCYEILNEEIETVKTKYPVLSREEEEKLCSLYQKGDKKALETLLLSNIGVWRMKALANKNPSVETEDMFQEIVAIVLEKAHKYNGKKAKFGTYMNSWCNLVLSNAFTTLSNRDKEYCNQILKAKETYYQLNNREPTEIETARFLGWTEKKYNRIHNSLCSGSFPVSLDAPVYQEDTENTSVMEKIGSDYYNPAAQYDSVELKEAFNEGWKKLTEVEKTVIKALFDFDTGERTDMSTRKLAVKLNVSHQTVANIRDKALNRLRFSYTRAGFNVKAV